MADTQLLLGLSFVLFALGLVGVMVRRNALVMLMCMELMLNAAPDARTLGRERKQDLLTGILAVARVVAKRKEKLLQQLGQLQANGAQDQLSHDIAMLAAGLQGGSETLAGSTAVQVLDM